MVISGELAQVPLIRVGTSSFSVQKLDSSICSANKSLLWSSPRVECHSSNCFFFYKRIESSVSAAEWCRFIFTTFMPFGFITNFIGTFPFLRTSDIFDDSVHCMLFFQYASVRFHWHLDPRLLHKSSRFPRTF